MICTLGAGGDHNRDKKSYRCSVSAGCETGVLQCSYSRHKVKQVFSCSGVGLEPRRGECLVFGDLRLATVSVYLGGLQLSVKLSGSGSAPPSLRPWSSAGKRWIVASS